MQPYAAYTHRSIRVELRSKLPEKLQPRTVLPHTQRHWQHLGRAEAEAGRMVAVLGATRRWQLGSSTAMSVPHAPYTQAQLQSRSKCPLRPESCGQAAVAV